MSIDTTVWATDLDAMISDLPCAAQFGNATFDCAASELTADETLMLVGNGTGVSCRVIFPITAFTATPTFKAQARFQLKFPNLAAFQNYEIVSIGYTPDSVAYEVILKADNRT